jgi:hypothetical protein
MLEKMCARENVAVRDTAGCSCYTMNYEAPFSIIFSISCDVQTTQCAVLQPSPIGYDRNVIKMS